MHALEFHQNHLVYQKCSSVCRQKVVLCCPPITLSLNKLSLLPDLRAPQHDSHRFSCSIFKSSGDIPLMVASGTSSSESRYIAAISIVLRTLSVAIAICNDVIDDINTQSDYWFTFCVSFHGVYTVTSQEIALICKNAPPLTCRLHDSGVKYIERTAQYVYTALWASAAQDQALHHSHMTPPPPTLLDKRAAKHQLLWMIW